MAGLQSIFTRFLLALFPSAMLFGCGGVEPSGNAGSSRLTSQPIDSAKPPDTQALPKRNRVRERLQGTWEIVRFESDKRIPDEAMPIMGALFNALRLQFDGTDAIARIENGKLEERTRFDVAQESGDEFTLIARGGMFDGARCRFSTDGQVEIQDVGEKWAGLSTLRRVR